VAPFLSDKLNPIFAREMRSGLLGKWEYLFRFSYFLTILTQVALLVFLLIGFYKPQYASTDLAPAFALWGKCHLALLMTFGAWFGARAIAPEREGQTLSQLFTIPLPPRHIIAGKLASVLTFTFYVQVLALPLAILLPMTELISWSMAGRFLLVETLLGALAAAWGIYCSFACHSVRSALSWALGGVAGVLVAHLLVESLVEILGMLGARPLSDAVLAAREMLPMPLLFPENGTGSGALLALLLVALLTLFLLLKTARDFQKMARES